mmetsp:Transcript_119498/g.283702  ORF Transcript_119498/g.283702 Transcript_119498/m.283702 type:complete len:94 (-) Transcript_119498:109-390(-)
MGCTQAASTKVFDLEMSRSPPDLQSSRLCVGVCGFRSSPRSRACGKNHTRDQTAKVQYVSFQWKAVQRSIVQFEWTLQHAHHLSAAVQTRFSG